MLEERRWPVFPCSCLFASIHGDDKIGNDPRRHTICERLLNPNSRIRTSQGHMKIHRRRFFLLVALAATFTALASAQEPATPAPPKPKASPALKLTGISGSASVTMDPSIPGIVHASQVTGVVAELVVFGCPVLIVAIMVFGRYRRAQLLHETLRVMVEKGAAIPPELLVPPKPPANDFRRGILLVSLGVGLIALLFHHGRGAWAVGLVPLLLGVGYLVLARLGEKPPAGPGPTLPS
jgi:Domain of unknown function (DUF6249)